MESDPKVSVIIPNYNHARFLSKRIESVLGQTYRDFEVVFLDDASTDNSLEVFERYAKDPRIRAIFNETNSGSPFKQWQKGLREAKGNYVWIAESDDFAEASFLETLVGALDANPSAGLAYCQSWLVDEKDGLLYENRKWTDDLDPERWVHSFVNRGRDEVARFLVHKNTIPNASAVLFRKDVAEAAGAVESSLTYCGDWLCWIRILLNSDLVFVAQSLNFWRQPHTQSMRGSIKSVRRVREILYLLERIKEKNVVASDVLNRACRKHYRHWVNTALASGVPWSAHREVVRNFSSLLTYIKMVDLMFAPFFLLRTVRRSDA